VDSFEIIWSFGPRREPWRFSEDDFVDATELFIALQRFVANVEGRFTLRLDRVEIHLDFSPDLATVFEELPDLLEAVRAGTKADFHFFEEGSDLRLNVEPGEPLTIRIATGRGSRSSFSEWPRSVFQVDRELFVAEWASFLRSLLHAIVDYGCPNDGSFERYWDRLLKLANSPRTETLAPSETNTKSWYVRRPKVHHSRESRFATLSGRVIDAVPPREPLAPLQVRFLERWLETPRGR